LYHLNVSHRKQHLPRAMTSDGPNITSCPDISHPGWASMKILSLGDPLFRQLPSDSHLISDL
jgi:hypothetical protein